MTKPVYILNGPNLNLLGSREPEIYGQQTLADIEAMCRSRASSLKIQLEFRQTNHEGTLLDWLHEARQAASGVIVNAGAYTHTSVALYDALKALTIPALEIHLSNPYRRESFRHVSYVSPVVTGSICGLGAHGYVLALDAISSLVGASNQTAR